MTAVGTQPARQQSGLTPVPTRQGPQQRTRGGTERSNLRRLRRTRVVLAIAAVLFGAVGAWTVQQHSAGAHDAATHSGPLAAETVKLYHALSDADATSATEYLHTGLEPGQLRAQYDADLKTAMSSLSAVSSEANGAKDAAPYLATVQQYLPEYVGRIEQARANNLQGNPLGARYLNLASNEDMQGKILPAAQKLAAIEAQNLVNAQNKATAFPYAEAGAVVVVLGFLLFVQVRESRRTNRVVNLGLLGATAGVVLSLVWMVGAFAVEHSQTNNAKSQGSDQTAVLTRAQIESLQARSDEMLNLVGHGAAPDKEVAYTGTAKVLRADLTTAASLAKQAGTAQSAALTDFDTWNQAHQALRQLDKDNKYADAVDHAINGDADKAFSALQTELNTSVGTTQAAFQTHAKSAENALTGLEIGLAVLGLAMAASVIAGLGRRISEYR